MAELRIYPHKEHAYENEIKRLKGWKISARNKDLITGFQNALFAVGAGKLRVTKLSSQLRRIALELDKDLDTASKEDVQSLIAYYNRQEKYSDETKADYRRCIKQFYRWYSDQDPRVESDSRS